MDSKFPPFPVSLRFGAVGVAVACWQHFLIRHNLYRGLLDGVFGKETEEATKEYQANRSLVVDGIVGSQTNDKASAEGFNGIDVEEAISLSYAAEARSLTYGPLEIIFEQRSGKATFYIDGKKNKPFTAKEAAREYRGRVNFGVG